ncbi:hypothetical protein ACFLRM_06550, partial [Acidobacteriota bacterium]
MINRRNFLKVLGLSAFAAAQSPSYMFSSQESKRQKNLLDLLDSGYPFPYDSEYFGASERVVFLDSDSLSINLLPKEGKALDIKLFHSDEDKIHILGSKTSAFYGVTDALEIPIRNKCWAPEFHYRIEYRETGENVWKAVPERTVKTPNIDVNNRGLEVILIGDDHTPDDADLGNRFVEDKYLRDLRLNGDYINLFLKELIKDPDFIPEEGSELAKLMNGFSLASTIRQIMANENPDIIFHLGDHRGGFGHKWKGLGLKKQFEATPEELDRYLKIFRVSTRKIFSALTPE